MAKYYGKIGYEITVEEPEDSGIWVAKTIERNAYGDVLKQSRRLENNQKVNDDINVSNQISIVADPFAYNHFHEMKYVKWYGANWKVTDVSVDYPRLVLTIGGVYNGGITQDATAA